MKVTVTYRHPTTKRIRTLKNVEYLGSAHAKAIRLDGKNRTINYPLPDGFRLTYNKSGNPVIRKEKPVDRRTAEGRAFMELASAVRAFDSPEKRYKGGYFTAKCYLYVPVPDTQQRRRAEWVEFPLNPRGEEITGTYQIRTEEQSLTLPMSVYGNFVKLSHYEKMFKFRNAYVFNLFASTLTSDVGLKVLRNTVAVSEWNIFELIALKGEFYNNELIKNIRAVTASNESLMVVYMEDIKRNQKLQKLIPSFFGSGYDVSAGRDNPLMNSPLIEYEIQRSDTMAGLIKVPEPGPDNACFFTFIWENLQADNKYQNRHKELYEEIKADPFRWMWNVCFPDKPYTGVFHEITAREVLPLFDILGKELKIFDATSHLWCHYKPPVRQESNREVLCMILHNNHVYPCNRSHKLAHYTESNKYDVVTGEVLPKWFDGTINETKKSVPFPLVRTPIMNDDEDGKKKNKKDIKTKLELVPHIMEYQVTVEAESGDTRFDAPPFYLDTLNVPDEIAKIVSQPEPSKAYTHYQFYTMNTMQSIYRLFIIKGAYTCGTVANSCQKWAGLNITNWVRNGVRLHIQIRPVPTLLRTVMDGWDKKEGENLLRNYFIADKTVKSAILSPNVVSQYSSHIRSWYMYYKRGGRAGHFISEDEFERLDNTRRLLGLDVAKFYTFILCSFKKLQVLSMFDNPTPYDGHEIEDYNTYEVRNIGETYTYRECALCLGLNLKRQPKDTYEILTYVRPSRLSDNHIPAIIQDLWSSDLDGDLKKIISNSMSGTLGMDHGNSHYSRAFFDQREAEHYMGFMNKNGTEYIKYDMNISARNIETRHSERSSTVWTLIQNDRSDFHSGFLPIYHMLIDTADSFMYALRKEIESFGLRVIGRHCDNLYLDIDYDDTEAVKEVCFGKLAYKMCYVEEDEDSRLGYHFVSNEYKSFGKLKPEEKRIGNKYNHFNVIACEPFEHPEVRTVRIVLTCDEWNEAEMFGIVDAHPFIFISADFAGSGKTCLSTNYIKHKGCKALVLTYQNDKVADLRKDFNGYENVTVSTIDSFFPYKREAVVKAYEELKKYDIVMVDEIDMTPIPTMTKLMRAVEQGLIKQMIVTGDVQQLEAINNYINNIKSQEVYYDNIKTLYFPTELRLREIKRARCHKHQVHYDLPTIRDCPDCLHERTTARRIYKSILEAPTDEIARQIVLDTFKHVESIHDVENENLITYLVDTRSVLNDFCHQRVLKEKGLPSNTNHYEGQKLVCSNRQDFKDGTIHRNYVVTFMGYQDEEEKTAIIHEPFEDKEYYPKSSSFCGHYRLSHAVTCHSKQGASIRGNTYIFDAKTSFAVKRWLYVAVSRNTNIWNNYIYTGKDISEARDEQTKRIIDRMIDSHRRADEKAGRSYLEEDYITSDFILDLLKKTRFCVWCQGDVTRKSFSIDRMDSELAHVKCTTQLLCSSKCNSAKGKNFEAVS
jgi:hypothetical protein